MTGRFDDIGGIFLHLIIVARWHNDHGWRNLGSGVQMTVVESILLAVSVVVFVYLGVAMFKPEGF